MELQRNSDTAYLILPKAHIHLVRCICLASSNTKLNMPILVECAKIYHIVNSAVEIRTHSVFHNVKLGNDINNVLMVICYSQSFVNIKIRNQITEGFTNSNMNQQTLSLGT